MLVLHDAFERLPVSVGAFVDGFLLVVISFPVLYLLVLRPLVEQVDARRRAESELRSQRDYLDVLVRERTRTVEEKNSCLVETMAELEKAVANHLDAERRFAHVFETCEEAIIVTNQDGLIVAWNASAQRIFGYSDREAVGKHHSILIAQRDHRAHRDQMRTLLQGTRRSSSTGVMALHGVAKNGAEIPVEVSFNTWKTGAGVFCSGVVRDTTERIKRDNERAQLVAAIEQLTEYVMITDTEGRIQYVNPSFVRETGFSHEDILGRTANLLNGLGADGSVCRAVWETLRRGETWRGFARNTKKDSTPYEEEVTITPVRDACGRVVNYVAIRRDVTEQRQSESRMRQAQKMEAIGLLAGGIAHDFNNILSAVLGYSEMALQLLPEGQPAREAIPEVIKAGQRARDLVHQILTFSRQSEHAAVPTLLEPLVKETLKFLEATVPPSVEIIRAIEPNCGAVLADSTQLHQILMNLCTNAYHAMQKEGGTMEVGLAPFEADAEFVRSHADFCVGRYLRLSVADTGHGMEPHIVERIFEPFFTTKGPGEGTGLGLSIVHGVIKNLGGAITVLSHPGHGTRFDVYLPQIEMEQSAKTSDADVIPAGNHERILLVDDEPALADLGKRVLERLDYEVDARCSSVEALKAFMAHPDRYALALCDYAMPQMNGVELARRMKSLREDLPVIICTGFADSILETAETTAVADAIILKPVILRDLTDTIRRVLDVPAVKS